MVVAMFSLLDFQHTELEGNEVSNDAKKGVVFLKIFVSVTAYSCL